MASEAAKRAYPTPMGVTFGMQRLDDLRDAYDRGVVDALLSAAAALRSHGVEHEPQANWLRSRADKIEKEAGHGPR